ncbi:MAG: transcription termination/antitermination protein NusA [Lachnospiraceae bacterium]|nr:transcription termination/antitermination protein NusA [Lachnospiraceae bacterium]
MNNELLEALNILEKEKDISKDTLLEAIENSLITACKNHFGKSDNIRVDMNPETCEFHVYAAKTVVEEVEDEVMEISLGNARMIDSKYNLGDVVNIEVKSKEFGRIATQNAKNVILQKIREEERKVLFDQYYGKEKDVVTGIVQRYVGRNISINLGKVDAVLSENEQVKGEVFQPTERIKLYILEVKSTSKGPKILVSRTHPELVKRLFESEVTEVKDGIVEIKSISREPGSRTKIAVWSNDPDVDPVGACVGMNGARVNAIVNELRGEKIDIINWSDNAAMLIENALSPAKVISVIADAEEKTAKVVVPDYQLSLAIGKEGQNARLAARLTGFKIDIKSETQAREAGDFMDYENDYEEYEEDDYSDDYAGDYEEASEDGYAGDYEEASEDGYAGDYEEASEDGYAGDYDEVSEDDYTGDYEEASEDSYAGDYDEVPKENYAELNEEPLSKESTGQGESDE